ncbi:MAG: ABC transporter substrate-binding protein [Chloroflexota bacterium]|nr:ABC transporter substrate-binding protein [Chloroflexota bacterium]
MNVSTDAVELTNRAIEALSRGDHVSARADLVASLRLDPDNEKAWLWLSEIVDSDEERRYCLEKAVAINHRSLAARALPDLQDADPEAPTELKSLDEPPAPPDLAALPDPHAEQVRRWEWVAILGVLALLAAAALVFFLRNVPRTEGSTIYVALVAPLTGERASVGQEMRYGVESYFAGVNEAGGIDGQHVEVLVYDDANDPELARQRAQEVVEDGRALLVIGHSTSSASLAAAPIYQAAGLPAISGSATTDSLTVDYPWYFRTLFNNSQQGQFLGAYAAFILDMRRAGVVYSDDAYGQSLMDDFIDEFGERGIVPYRWALAADAGEQTAVVEEVIDEATGDHPPEVIFLAVLDQDARDLIVALRRAGFEGLIIGTDSVGRPAFPLNFVDEAEERDQPGFFTTNLLAASPLIFDTATAEAQDLAADYQADLSSFPSWTVAKYYDAALLAAYGIGQADIADDAVASEITGERIRDTMASVNSFETALQGINGPLYLDEERTAVQPMAIGTFANRIFQSAPTQLMPLLDLRDLDLVEEAQEGLLLRIGDQLVRVVRVVYSGMEINEISDVDLSDSSYLVDFYLWLRFTGDEQAADIVFSNAVQGGLTPGRPIRADVYDGVNYRLYRVKARFREPFDFRDYPFDQQNLTVRFQNETATRDQILYVVDKPTDSEDVEGLAVTVSVPDSFPAIASWIVRGIVLFQDVVRTDSSFGDPRLGDEDVRVEYSRFNADVRLQRDALGFLAKHLVPLLLLISLLYASLFVPFGTGLVIRVNLATISILTSAVLLGNISDRLPDIGYTVAIEYGFYFFFALALGAVVVAIIGNRWSVEGETTRIRQLNLFTRFLFPVLVFAVVLVYVVQYAVR